MSNKKEKEYMKDAVAAGVIDRPIELGDLRRNPEGIVHVDTKLEPTQLCTVVTGRKFLGYGGPLAINDIEGRGTFKCHADDGLYELSDGGQYVLPHNLAEALGIVIPDPDPVEMAAIREQAGLPPEEVVEAPAAQAKRPELKPKTDDFK